MRTKADAAVSGEPDAPLGRTRDASPIPGTGVFTVPPGRAFLPALARAVLDGHLPRPGGPVPDALALPTWTILLPTRRAARALQEAFLAAAGREALLLPRIRPIAEGEEDLALLASTAGLMFAGADAEVPPAMGELERRLTLTSLVLRWSAALRARDPADADAAGAALATFAAAGAATPAQAAHLARELARLMDMVETEGVGLDALDGLVPEMFSAHWQQTLGFLEIVTRAWPAHLAERGVISAVERRNRLIRAEARLLEANPPAGPVIVAGVTGSIPATAELMQAILRLPHGAIVLPGLDTSLDPTTWSSLLARDATAPGHPEHPQHGLALLLARLGLDRSQVAVLPGAAPQPASADRTRLLSEAMLPSAATAGWHTFAAEADKPALARALEGVSLVAAPTSQDEAEVVALILREAAETPGRTAALVTPDRLLARRVTIRLQTWGIRIDDSAGRPFAKTVAGSFLDLVAEVADRDFAPPALMALLKHPLTRLGMPASRVRQGARALEIAAFRGPYLGRGIDGVTAALEAARLDTASGERRGRAVRRLHADRWQAAHDLVARLTEAFAPLAALHASRRPHALAEIAGAHVAAAEALCARPLEESPEGESELWREDAGVAAAALFAGLLDEALPAPEITAADYAALYRSLVAGESVRQRVAAHPRLFVWGPMEARLQQPDVVVLGGLNEGTWPEQADPGPWLNRPMRATLGLPSPETRLGQAAHDFAMLAGGGEVILTRAEKVDGVPAVPSRWLMRLTALLGGLGLGDALVPDRPWLAWARRRDAIATPVRLAPPAPRPPLALRPRRLSVSAVETFIANPYAIYARFVLGLEPLAVLAAPPDGALRGAIVHEALSRFTRDFPTALPVDVEAALMQRAQAAIAAYAGNARIAAFWLPRLARFARWFAETEPSRRAGLTTVLAEVSGTLPIPAPAGEFLLTARADRIDVGPTGLVILDYKTGIPPVPARVVSGEAPQLPLEAAMAEAGVLEGVPVGPVTGLAYIRASGGEPAGVTTRIPCPDVSALARGTLAGLTRLVAAYDDPQMPYAAVRRPRFRYDYDDFAHLARVAEWSAGDVAGDAE